MRQNVLETKPKEEEIWMINICTSFKCCLCNICACKMLATCKTISMQRFQLLLESSINSLYSVRIRPLLFAIDCRITISYVENYMEVFNHSSRPSSNRILFLHWLVRLGYYLLFRTGFRLFNHSSNGVLLSCIMYLF